MFCAGIETLTKTTCKYKKLNFYDLLHPNLSLKILTIQHCLMGALAFQNDCDFPHILLGLSTVEGLRSVLFFCTYLHPAAMGYEVQGIAETPFLACANPVFQFH